MRRSAAAVGSAIFFLIAPGTVAGLVPWAITGWHIHPSPLGWLTIALGAMLTLAAAAVIVNAFVRFAMEGLGTPLPAAPPTQLVIGGAYRYVRNPMYVAVLAAILGQTLIFWQAALLWYVLLVAASTFAFVKLYEEPNLERRFGDDYRDYRKAVPGWWPRLRPWRPADGA